MRCSCIVDRKERFIKDKESEGLKVKNIMINLIVSYTGDGDSQHSDSIISHEVKYCPFCGRTTV